MKLALLAALLFASPAFAQQDAANYCRYIGEQARAQADQLWTPSLVTGLSQPTAGTPIAAFTGLRNSIANDRQASLTLSLGRAQCDVYKTTQSAQLRIEYALPNLQKEALNNRLSLIQQAERNLEVLIQESQQKVDSRNLTLPALYALQSVKTRLEADRAQTSASIAGIATVAAAPDGTPIRDLVQSKLSAEQQMERTSDKKQAVQNWDIALDVGARQRLDTPASDPYGEVIFTYSLGARAATRHLRQSEIAHQEWKRNQQSDVAQDANDLKAQLQNLIAAKRDGLAALIAREQLITDNLAAVDGVETSAAIAFRDQLRADHLLLRIEIGDMSFSLDQLTGFLAVNF